MHQQKGKKTLIYLFLFVIVGSINNIGLSNAKLENIKNINIFGLDNIENINLKKQIKALSLGNIFFLDKKKISKIISSNSLVENYDIFKRYPHTLDINIKKTEFLAKITNDGKIYLIGSNGKLSDVKFLSKKLPYIFGKPEIKEFLEFKDLINQSNFSLKEIENLYFFPSKRWDIELKNNVLLKLSKDYPGLSLKHAFVILNDNNLNDTKLVDARIKNQIILND